MSLSCARVSTHRPPPTTRIKQSKMAVYQRLVVVSLLSLYLSISIVHCGGVTEQSDLFEAAFQGECRTSNPCQQLCFDLHDGTYECACHDGFHLNINGYSCHKLNETSVTETSSKLSAPAPPTSMSSITAASHSNFMNRFFSAGSNSKPEEVKEQLEEEEDESHPVIEYEKPLYSCADVECEAGGVCIESPQEPKVRCRCALGRGGQFCERIIEIQHPEFRGTSYLALPTLRNAQRSMQLQVEFKPESFNGVLLYSGQAPDLTGDFIAIVINQGFVEFRFDCGMGVGILRSDLPVYLSSWNSLTIFRDGRNAWMQLNSGQQIFGHSKGLFSRITFRLETFLGGSPNITQIAHRVDTDRGLVGCVRSLRINEQEYDFSRDTIDGIDIDQCKSDACSTANCLNGAHCALDEQRRRMCVCPLGFTGEFCEIETKFLIPAFNGSSHLQTVGLGESASLYTEIVVLLKPTKPDGLFLYNGQKMDRTGDFISLSLVDGFVEFRFDLGSGAAVIQSERSLPLNEWHIVRAIRTGREGFLHVNDQLPSTGVSLGAFTQISLPLNLYLGGVPSLKNIHQNVQSAELFSGCIQRVRINDKELNFQRDILSGARIENCEHHCNDRPCKNGGWCRPERNWYSCHCRDNFIGAHCERNTFSTLTQDATVTKSEKHSKTEVPLKKQQPPHPPSQQTLPMFYGNSFLRYNASTLGPKMVGFETVFHLTLRAFSSKGMILWLGGTQSGPARSDYLSLGLEGGHLEMNVNLGSGNHRVLFNATRLDDGQWHRVHFARYGKQIMVRIDENTVMQNAIRGNRIRLDAIATLFLGGLEDTELESKGLYQKGYIGCIANLTIGELHEIGLVSHAERGANIRSCI